MATSVPIVSAASIDQRFAQLIQQFGLTKNSFAMSLGKTASVVQHLIDGRNKPGFDLMCKVFEIYPNVSRDWLLLGRGPMLVGSNGISTPPQAAITSAAPEPDFEPIDLTDVAPRAPRRASTTRLHPEEIAATLALASAVAEDSAATVTVPMPDSPDTSGTKSPEASVAHPLLNSTTAATAKATLPDPAAAVAPSFQRLLRPFRPGLAPAGRPNYQPTATPETPTVPASKAAPEIAASTPAQAAPAAPVTPSLAEPVASPQTVAAPLGGPEAYVSAAIHAQHLQHQMALAELRNQHLLEQQQMLREMLAMARQNMV